MSTSITETKLLIMLHVDKKFIWWLNLFKKIEFSSDSDQQMTLYNDNLQTIRLLISKIAKVDTKLRHVDVAQCWLREFVQRDILKMNYLLIAKMTTNEMTKILSSQKHKKFIKQLNLVNIKNLMKMNNANDSNWDSRLCENRVVTNIKKIRWRKNRFFEFSISRCSCISTMQASQHLKRISNLFSKRFQNYFQSSQRDQLDE
jgi:vacuolar-type H+-ATPase catalytic subunit A/Vma1